MITKTRFYSTLVIVALAASQAGYWGCKLTVADQWRASSESWHALAESYRATLKVVVDNPGLDTSVVRSALDSKD